MNRSAALVAVVLVGCGAAGKRAAEPAAHGGEGPRRGIEAAALPFHVLDRDGKDVPTEQFFAELAAADAVCVGESHSNPHHHWFQLHVVDQLTGAGGRRGLALGMEMFQTPFQKVLDDYAAGRIDEKAMLSRTGWKKRWGYDWGLYRPIVQLAVTRGVPVLALNAPKELTRKVGKGGLESLSADERARLPELDLDDDAHRAWFDGVMEGHPGSAPHGGHGGVGGADEEGGEGGEAGEAGQAEGDGHGDGHGGGEAGAAGDGRPSSSSVYVAQVLWDETMAHTAARWLGGGEGRGIIMLAGTGHCHDSAIVNRMRRRGARRVVSVHPVIDDGEGNVADALVSPRNDYIVVMTFPE